MELQIKIIDKEITNKGKYNQLEISYKNLQTGKVESKKIMSFVQPEDAYKALVDSNTNDVFTISADKEKSPKDGKEYWVWKTATQAAPGTMPEAKAQAASAGYAAPKSNYETPEERAKKQVYIVKQSSISAAIQALSIGAKTPPSPDTIIEVAQKFVDYVFGQEQIKQVSLADMPDDFPDVN